jgi:hypothetical protein
MPEDQPQWSPPEATRFGEAWNRYEEPEAPNARSGSRLGNRGSSVSPAPSLGHGRSPTAPPHERLFSHAAEHKQRRDALAAAAKAAKAAEEAALVHDISAHIPGSHLATTTALVSHFWASAAAEMGAAPPPPPPPPPAEPAAAAAVVAACAGGPTGVGEGWFASPALRDAGVTRPLSASAASSRAGSPLRSQQSGAGALAYAHWAPGGGEDDCDDDDGFAAAIFNLPAREADRRRASATADAAGGAGAAAGAAAVGALPVEARLARYAELVASRRAKQAAAREAEVAAATPFRPTREEALKSIGPRGAVMPASAAPALAPSPSNSASALSLLLSPSEPSSPPAGSVSAADAGGAAWRASTRTPPAELGGLGAPNARGGGAWHVRLGSADAAQRRQRAAAQADERRSSLASAPPAATTPADDSRFDRLYAGSLERSERQRAREAEAAAAAAPRAFKASAKSEALVAEAQRREQRALAEAAHPDADLAPDEPPPPQARPATAPVGGPSLPFSRINARDSLAARAERERDKAAAQLAARIARDAPARNTSAAVRRRAVRKAARKAVEAIAAARADAAPAAAAASEFDSDAESDLDSDSDSEGVEIEPEDADEPAAAPRHAGARARPPRRPRPPSSASSSSLCLLSSGELRAALCAVGLLPLEAARAHEQPGADEAAGCDDYAIAAAAVDLSSERWCLHAPRLAWRALTGGAASVAEGGQAVGVEALVAFALVANALRPSAAAEPARIGSLLASLEAAGAAEPVAALASARALAERARRDALLGRPPVVRVAAAAVAGAPHDERELALCTFAPSLATRSRQLDNGRLAREQRTRAAAVAASPPLSAPPSAARAAAGIGIGMDDGTGTPPPRRPSLASDAAGAASAAGAAGDGGYRPRVIGSAQGALMQGNRRASAGGGWTPSGSPAPASLPSSARKQLQLGHLARPSADGGDDYGAAADGGDGDDGGGVVGLLGVASACAPVPVSRHERLYNDGNQREVRGRSRGGSSGGRGGGGRGEWRRRGAGWRPRSPLLAPVRSPLRPWLPARRSRPRADPRPARPRLGPRRPLPPCPPGALAPRRGSRLCASAASRTSRLVSPSGRCSSARTRTRPTPQAQRARPAAAR